MLFQVLSGLLAVALLTKATIALATRQRFYAMRQRQYASECQPPQVVVTAGVVIILCSLAWYATIFHYRPHGWIVTLFFTLLSCGSVNHLLHWKKHRQRMLKVVSSPKVWIIDCFLLALGGGFAALASLVYKS